MHLLVCVINRQEDLERVLSGFVELGVTGATVLESRGMARLVSRELPVLAGLQAVLAQARPTNSTVFSVIESTERLEAAVRMVEKVCGGLDAPASGIVFTVPVERAIGMAHGQTPGGGPSD
jgi:nitrogen regulatory protein P-II 1